MKAVQELHEARFGSARVKSNRSRNIARKSKQQVGEGCDVGQRRGVIATGEGSLPGEIFSPIGHPRLCYPKGREHQKRIHHRDTEP